MESKAIDNPAEKIEFSTFNKAEIIKWLVTFIVPLIIWLIPMPVENNIKLFIIITSWAITSWIVVVIPVVATGLLLPCLYLFFNVAPSEVVFAPWSNTVVWMTVALIVIGLAADKSGLSLRMAYKIILKMDTSLRGLIWSFSIAGIVLAFIITDSMARCIVFVTIAIGVCKALGIEPKSKEATALTLAAFFGMAGPSIGSITAGNGIYFNSVFREAAGYDITYFQWLLHNFFPSLAWTLIGAWSIIKVLKIGRESCFDAKDELKRRYESLGTLTQREIFVFIFLLMVIIAVIFSGSFGLDPLLVVSLFVPFMFIPGIRIVNLDDFDLADFKILFVMTGAMSIGATANNVGLVDIIIKYLTPLIAGSAVKMVIGSYIFATLANFILTPLAIVFTFTGLFTQMAIAAGVNPLPVVYALNLGTDVYVFPYEYAILLIAFSFGYMKYSDAVKVLLVRALASFLVIALVAIPLWLLLGLI